MAKKNKLLATPKDISLNADGDVRAKDILKVADRLELETKMYTGGNTTYSRGAGNVVNDLIRAARQEEISKQYDDTKLLEIVPDYEKYESYKYLAGLTPEQKREEIRRINIKNLQLTGSEWQAIDALQRLYGLCCSNTTDVTKKDAQGRNTFLCSNLTGKRDGIIYSTVMGEDIDERFCMEFWGGNLSNNREKRKDQIKIAKRALKSLATKDQNLVINEETDNNGDWEITHYFLRHIVEPEIITMLNRKTEETRFYKCFRLNSFFVGDASQGYVTLGDKREYIQYFQDKNGVTATVPDYIWKVDRLLRSALSSKDKDKDNGEGGRTPNPHLNRPLTEKANEGQTPGKRKVRVYDYQINLNTLLKTISATDFKARRFRTATSKEGDETNKPATRAGLDIMLTETFRVLIKTGFLVGLYWPGRNPQDIIPPLGGKKDLLITLNLRV